LSEIVKGMDRVEEKAQLLSLPMLIMQGTEDRIVSPKGADFLHSVIASEDNTLKIYDGFYHELFHDPEKDLVFDDIKAWLERRI